MSRKSERWDSHSAISTSVDVATHKGIEFLLEPTKNMMLAQLSNV